MLKSGGPVKSSTVVLLALLALAVLFLLTRRKEASGQKFGSTDEFIQFMAARAVKAVSTSLRQVLTEFIESFHLTSQVC